MNEAVPPTPNVPTVTVSMLPDGQLQIGMNVQDMIVVVGMLNRAAFAVQANQQQPANGSPILIARGGLPRRN